MDYAPLIIVGLLVWFVRWIVVSNRFRRLEQRLSDQDATISRLRRRIDELEPPKAAPPPVPKPVAEPVHVPVLPPPIPAVPLARPASVEPPHLPPPIPEPPRETTAAWLRRSVGDQEWEAMVGGNWLNKVGVLVLVIGIALFLGYTFTRMGPAGRVAIGLGVSLAMLIGGVLVERKALYRVFARGLIGGGWAALYFTAYAMHAVAAARVIENGYAGSALLLAVAAGMIAHSLRYRSQTVSGLAYFIAFGTLALADSTPFSVLAMIPLAASLLVLAYRFGWYQMAVFGTLATYGTCASRPDAGSPLGSTQALFAVYWVLFEAFDLMRLRRRDAGPNDASSSASLILPFNALGFLGLSIVKWHRAAPPNVWQFVAAAAALYLASALLRVFLAGPADERTPALQRIAAGRYEGPITLAAVLAGFSIALRAQGLWVNTGWLIEAELLFLAGWWFDQTYLRRLSAVGFGVLLAKLAGADVPAGGSVVLVGHTWMRWTPVAAASAAIFYINRILRVAEGVVFSSAGSALVALIIFFEVPQLYGGAAWLLFGALLLELGLRIRKAEFRYQGYAAGVLGLINVLYLHVVLAERESPRSEWISLTAAALICGAVVARLFRAMPERIPDVERSVGRDMAAAGATVFLMTLAWLELPPVLVALAWAAISLVLLETGFATPLLSFRVIGNITAAAVIGRLFLANFTDLGNTLRLSHRILTVGPIVVSQYYVWWRYRRVEISAAEKTLARLYLYAPAILTLALMRFELGRTVTVVGWAVFGLVLYRIGMLRQLVDLRWQSLAIAALAFWRSWSTNFYIAGSLAGIGGRVLTGAAVILAFYVAQLLSPRDPREAGFFDRHARTIYSLLASVLLAVLLFYEVSGGMLTLAWGVEAVALLAIGFPLRDRLQRLTGLFLFLVCVLKLFLYDFRQLETLNRIVSFIALGAILVSVSWIYTRFRGRIQRYL